MCSPAVLTSSTGCSGKQRSVKGSGISFNRLVQKVLRKTDLPEHQKSPSNLDPTDETLQWMQNNLNNLDHKDTFKWRFARWRLTWFHLCLYCLLPLRARDSQLGQSAVVSLETQGVLYWLSSHRKKAQNVAYLLLYLSSVSAERQLSLSSEEEIAIWWFSIPVLWLAVDIFPLRNRYQYTEHTTLVEKTELSSMHSFDC